MFPEIQISEQIVLPTYLLWISLVYCLLLYLLARRAPFCGQSSKTALDIALVLMVSGFIGGRAAHVLFENLSFYVLEPLEILKFWQGGFVFYGGFLIAVLSSFIYLHYRRLSFLVWADFFAPLLALGYGLGRIGCFFAGCCYGRFCELPWAVQFSWDLERLPRHPTQLYATFWELGVALFLSSLSSKEIFQKNKGALFHLWLALHGIGRWLMEYYRDDFRGARLAGWSLGQWISLGLIIYAFTWLATRQRRGPKSRKVFNSSTAV